MNAVFATYAYTFDKSGNVIVGDRTEWSYGRFGRFQGWDLLSTILLTMILGRSCSEKIKIAIKKEKG